MQTGLEVFMIRGSQKGRLMMVEPPSDFRRRGILEVDDSVFVAGKVGLVEKRACPMHQAVIFVCRGRIAGGNAFAVKSCE